MAQKKITDLTLRSSFDETTNFPVDDATQTWRVTGAQMVAYLKTLAFNDVKVMAFADTGYALSKQERTAVVNATGGQTDATLPVASTVPGFEFTLIKTDASANAARFVVSGGGTINGASSQSADNQYSTLKVKSTGSEYVVVS